MANEHEVVCPPCGANLGPDLAREIGDCHRHHAAVQALARQLAVFFDHENPTDEHVGWFIEDAMEVAEQWATDHVATVVDLGVQRDDRRHLLIDGERWAEPDPNAEGFNPIVPMTACTHPWLLAPDDPEFWPFDDEDSPCELCLGSGWTSYTPEELAESAIIASQSAADAADIIRDTGA